MNETDQVLAACQGDQAAWTAVVQQHQNAVFRLAYLLLGDADEAEDVAQEAFVRAFYALARFDTTRPLRSWLLQIAKNPARNRRRAGHRYWAALQRWWQLAPTGRAASSPAAHTQQVGEQAAQELWQAVQHLSLSDQEVIYLRYFLEMSGADTAIALGIAEGTVKSRLSRA